MEYGEDNFEFAIIHAVTDRNLLDSLEQKYIAQYKKNGLAYNIADGGSASYFLGKHLSEETKRKIGEKNRVHMTGKKDSPETKARKSAAQQARFAKWTDEDRKAWGEKLLRARTEPIKWSDEARQRFAELQHERPNSAVLTPDDVRSIRAKRAAGATMAAIAREYNTSSGNISNIVNRKRWAYIS